MGCIRTHTGGSGGRSWHQHLLLVHVPSCILTCQRWQAGSSWLDQTDSTCGPTGTELSRLELKSSNLNAGNTTRKFAFSVLQESRDLRNGWPLGKYMLASGHPSHSHKPHPGLRWCQKMRKRCRCPLPSSRPPFSSYRLQRTLAQGKGEENFKADLKPFNDALHPWDDWFSDLKEQQKPGLWKGSGPPDHKASVQLCGSVTWVFRPIVLHCGCSPPMRTFTCVLNGIKLKSLDLDKLKARVLRGPRKETSIVYLW